jgi:hypothetical protein
MKKDSYCADTEVCGSRLVQVKGNDNKFKVHVKPDAGIMVWLKLNVVAVMEFRKLENFAELHSKDMGKCVLLTSMTALDVRQHVGVTTDIMIPFVLGTEIAAELYVTCLFQQSSTPVIMLVGKYACSNHKHRVNFFATLAVLVRRALSLFQDPEGFQKLMLSYPEMKDRVAPYPNYFDEGYGKKGTRTTRSRSSARSSKIAGTATGTHDNNKRRNTSSFASAAKHVAMCSGSIINLEAVEVYGTQSPYYFKGDYDDENKNRCDVFCKVWHEAEEKKSRKHMISELKHLKMAYELGVPCPRVIEKLSRTDVEYDGKRFHVLVMTYHPQDNVDARDVTRYAQSLIKAVAVLHTHAMLHCDIKPLNIAWNSKSKEIVLLDFGLVQMQAGAKWYRVTKKYEAPEIENNKAPHSTLSVLERHC